MNIRRAIAVTVFTVLAAVSVSVGAQTSSGVVEGTAYRLNELPPGSYSVRFELAGFEPVQQTDVVLTIGSDITLPVQLQVGSVRGSP